MDRDDFENELVGMLALAKQQQANIEYQLRAVQAAAASVEEGRRQLAALLKELRDAPKTVREGLNSAIGDAIGAELPRSIAAQRKSLAGAVKRATEAFEEAGASFQSDSQRLALSAVLGCAVGVFAGGGLVFMLLRLAA